MEMVLFYVRCVRIDGSCLSVAEGLSEARARESDRDATAFRRVGLKSIVGTSRVLRGIYLVVSFGDGSGRARRRRSRRAGVVSRAREDDDERRERERREREHRDRATVRRR